METIATIKISKPDAISAFMSYERLKNTAGNPNGPLQKIILWFRAQYGNYFSLSCIHIGKPEEDYILMYYFCGTRYKIDRDGIAHVSTADADIFLEDTEKDLQMLVDNILNDELNMCLKAVVNAKECKFGTTKYTNEENPEDHSQSICGIFKEVA